jgi:hypothetical protein
MINEFKFFKGITSINDNTLLFQTGNGLLYTNIVGELAYAASDLQNRVIQLEEEINYLRNNMNTLLLNS